MGMFLVRSFPFSNKVIAYRFFKPDSVDKTLVFMNLIVLINLLHELEFKLFEIDTFNCQCLNTHFFNLISEIKSF